METVYLRAFSKLCAFLVLLLFLSGAARIPQATAESGEVKNASELQNAIDAASGEATVTISDDIVLSSAIVIENGKRITLTDDGASRKISGNQACLFRIEEGGRLTIRTSTGADDLLTLEGPSSHAGYVGSANTGSIIDCSGSFVLHSGTLCNSNVYHSYYYGPISIHGKNASFTMTGGLICRNNIEPYNSGSFTGNKTGTVVVSDSAAFTMSGGKISNNTLRKGTGSGGFDPCTPGVLIASGASFEMSGGEISSNKTADDCDYRFYGGGVFLLGETPGEANRAKMTLSGDARISDNTITYAGGGICIFDNAELTMTGGTISNNTSFTAGGGIIAFDTGANTDSHPAALTMTGGTISGNKTLYGGGIYVVSNWVSLQGGAISENNAQEQGGGIYVGSGPYSLRMYNALITGNTADALGGGLWYCPTGDAVVTVTSGGAIFGNSCKSGGAGDDFASVAKQGGHSTSIADRMLGGGPVAWYTDGAIRSDGSSLGNADPGAPRFNPKAPGTPLTEIIACTDSLALKSVVTDEAIRLARQQAKLLVTGNHAKRGGGIGSNGSIVIGDPGRAYTLNVKKTWSADVQDENKRPVVVSLTIGDSVLDSVTLDAQHGWEAAFTQLPDPASLASAAISVVENPVPKGFEASYSVTGSDSANRRLSITVNNRPTASPTAAPASPAMPVPSDLPKTGDSSHLALWLFLMGAASSGAILLCLACRKNPHHSPKR